MSRVLTGRQHELHLRPADDRPDGAPRPDGAELAAPFGHAVHLHRLLRVQGGSAREARAVPPHCPGHTSDPVCNAG
jgi:hypothetical protein